MTMRQHADPGDPPIDAEALAALAVAGEAEPAPTARTPPLARHGRGATINPASRYDQQVIHAFDDGWDTLGAECAELHTYRTQPTGANERNLMTVNQVSWQAWQAHTLSTEDENHIQKKSPSWLADP